MLAQQDRSSPQHTGSWWALPPPPSAATVLPPTALCLSTRETRVSMPGLLVTPKELHHAVGCHGIFLPPLRQSRQCCVVHLHRCRADHRRSQPGPCEGLQPGPPSVSQRSGLLIPGPITPCPQSEPFHTSSCPDKKVQTLPVSPTAPQYPASLLALASAACSVSSGPLHTPVPFVWRSAPALLTGLISSFTIPLQGPFLTALGR